MLAYVQTKRAAGFIRLFKICGFITAPMFDSTDSHWFPLTKCIALNSIALIRLYAPRHSTHKASGVHVQSLNTTVVHLDDDVEELNPPGTTVCILI